jgi:hypothetical protein
MLAGSKFPHDATLANARQHRMPCENFRRAFIQGAASKGAYETAYYLATATLVHAFMDKPSPNGRGTTSLRGWRPTRAALTQVENERNEGEVHHPAKDIR